MIKQQFPGKLFVIGEYSAVISGFTSVIAAISKFLTVEIESSSSTTVTSKHGYLDMNSMRENAGKMEFVRQAIMIAQEFSGISEPFKLNITSDLESEEKKYGFGSSGVVVVAVISALLTHYGKAFSKLELFKLSVLVQKKLGNLGSGGDIASTIYGGVIAYTRFDAEWLEIYGNDLSIVEIDWPLLKIENLNAEILNLVVGWTQFQNSTSPYVAKFEILRESNSPSFNKLVSKSKAIVSEFLEGVSTNDKTRIVNATNVYRNWMLELQSLMNLPIETEPLTTLINDAKSLNFASKISGAGGGDCGIVLNVWNDYENIEKLRETWLKHGILMLDIEVI